MRRLRAAASLLLVAALGCDSEAPAVPGALLFTNALIVDGSGGEPFEADLRIVEDRIHEIGDLRPAPGEPVVDVGGLVLAPGFIDTHSHADWAMAEHPEAEAAVSQGITTVVVGNDGASHLPLQQFFGEREAAPAAINVASYTGHGSLRAAVMGDDWARAADADEIARMAELLTADLEAGSLGLSTGLEYDPGIYSTTQEVIDLARVAAARGGRYISHMRSEDRNFWEALDEIIRIGREAALPVQISHMKLAMKGIWGEAETALAILDAARAEGIDVTADVYPYPFWQSTLTVVFPERDFDDLEEARLVVEQLMPPEGALIAHYLPEPAYAGKTLAEIARLRDEEPAAALLALIRMAESERALSTGAEIVESVIGTSMSEQDIERLIAWPHSNFCTDGELRGAHPRGYGSFPRILGRYVRERGVIALPEAIRKASSLAADHVGLADRGRIAVGQHADLVILDPARVVDRATTEAPHTISLGIEQVWVNGVRVWDGAVTPERPGRVLRRGATSGSGEEGGA